MEEFLIVAGVLLCLFGFSAMGYQMGSYAEREYKKCRELVGIETCVKHVGLEK